MMSNWRVSFMIALRGATASSIRAYPVGDACIGCLPLPFVLAVDTDSGTRAAHPRIARSTSDQLVLPQENERERHQQKGDDPQLKGDL
jgi:hypothetical protein